jgi:hypothetical protein
MLADDDLFNEEHRLPESSTEDNQRKPALLPLSITNTTAALDVQGFLCQSLNSMKRLTCKE